MIDRREDRVQARRDGSDGRGRILSAAYQVEYAALLARLCTVRARRAAAQALFWPKVGRLYDGDLLVIGRR